MPEDEINPKLSKKFPHTHTCECFNNEKKSTQNIKLEKWSSVAGNRVAVRFLNRRCSFLLHKRRRTEHEQEF